MPGINQREDVAAAAVRCCLRRYPAPASPFSSSSLSIRSDKRREKTRFSFVGDLVAALVQRFPVESTKYEAKSTRLYALQLRGIWITREQDSEARCAFVFEAKMG